MVTMVIVITVVMNRMMRVITIDGPAASGKSSVSRGVAEKLGWLWLSTGAFYRGLAFVAQQKRVDLEAEEELAALCKDPSWEVSMTPAITKVFLNGDDVTDGIYTESIGSVASQISFFPKVRKNLLVVQRACSLQGVGLIAEGRDCGTVVFPQAFIKFFLTAESGQRALRRTMEKQGRTSEDISTTLEAQRERDAKDAQRACAPMKVAAGAHVVCTDDMGLDEVIEYVYSRCVEFFFNAGEKVKDS